MIQRLIYSFLYSLILIFLLPFELRKRPKDLRGIWLREKFGAFNFSLLTSNSPVIWIHAVSVGEAAAAMPLLGRIKEKYPDCGLVLSTITDTGQKMAAQRAPDGTMVIYLPFDLGFIFKRVLRHIRPKVFITMETEIWPNLFRTLSDECIPLIVLNGRISENSFRGYKKIRFFIRDVIRRVDLFGMQDDVYAERIRELGASEERVKVTGNLKFDIRPSEKIPEWTKLISTPFIIAGSTHRKEEDIILSAYGSLKKDFPDLGIVIAPRHPERFEEVEDLVKSKGIPYMKSSQLSLIARIGLLADPPVHNVVILDAVGELSSVYAACDIAVIGGSFIEHGGQNLLEPAFWARPIICGPHMENFPFAKEFYEKGGAIEATASDLGDKLRQLLASPDRRAAIGNKAKELCNEKSGAVERALGEIEKYLKTDYGK